MARARPALKSIHVELRGKDLRSSVNNGTVGALKSLSYQAKSLTVVKSLLLTVFCICAHCTVRSASHWTSLSLAEATCDVASRVKMN